MIDDRPIVDLINSRFDDLVGRVEDMKRDLLRGQEKHEIEDKERFKALDLRVHSVEKIYWKVSGAVIVIIAFVKALERLLFT